MHSVFGLGRTTFAAIAFAAVALAISACAGTATSNSSVSSQTLPRHATATPTPVVYAFQTVDDPSQSGYNTKVTGINDDAVIVGYYGTNGFNSFTATKLSGKYTIFTNDNSPDSHTYASTYGGTVMSAIATTVTSSQPSAEAGYVYDPGGLLGGGSGTELGVWGVADNQGLWTLLKLHPNQRGSSCTNHIFTELFGINASGYVAGTYSDPTTCRNRAFYGAPGDSGPGGYNNLNPTGAYDSTAAGINDGLDVVGWLHPSASGKAEAWYASPSGSTYTFTSDLTFQGSGDATQAYGVNKTSAVVGTFTDSNGTHGFLLLAPTGVQYWEKIDELNATGTTEVTGINDNGQVCGWYIDSKGTHGFVGTPVVINTNARPKGRH